MKSTSLCAATAAGLFLASVSCERHEWEETKVLHEKHGHGAAHESGHPEDDNHGPETPAEEKPH